MRNLRIGGAGVGLLATEADVGLQGVHIFEATEIGVYAALSATQVTLTQTLVEATLPRPDTLELGRGIQLVDGAELSTVASAVVANHDTGVMVSGTGSEIAMTGSLIEGTLPRQTDLEVGVGLQIREASRATLQSSAVVHNHAAGAIVTNPNSELAAADCLVARTEPRQSDQRHGRGIELLGGAHATLDSCAIVENHKAGLYVSDVDTEVTATACLISATQPEQSDHELGRGLKLLEGARGTVSSCAVIANHDSGVVAFDEGTELTMSVSLIEGTLPRASDEVNGYGVRVTDGADVTLESCAVIANHTSGLLAEDQGSQLTATAGLVQGTLPRASDQALGDGIQALSSASAAIHSTAVIANHTRGVFGTSTGTEVRVDCSLVAHTQPQQSDQFHGEGLWLQAGAHAVVASSAVVDNHEVGVLGAANATIEMTASLIEATQPHPTFGDYGQGLRLKSNADAVLYATTVRANREVGVVVSNTGTSLAANACLIEGTLPRQADQQMGKASPSKRERRHHDAAIYAARADAEVPAELSVTGSLVAGTLPRLHDGAYGISVVCDAGATLAMGHTTVRHGYVAGVAIWDCAAEITDTTIDDVLDGHFFMYEDNEPVAKFENVGDGLIATHSATTTVTNTRIQGCARAGILFDASAGHLAAVISTDNRFGISLQGAPQPTFDTASSFAGNTEKDILSDGNLPVPSQPPEMPEPP